MLLRYFILPPAETVVHPPFAPFPDNFIPNRLLHHSRVQATPTTRDHTPRSNETTHHLDPRLPILNDTASPHPGKSPPSPRPHPSTPHRLSSRLRRCESLIVAHHLLPLRFHSRARRSYHHRRSRLLHLQWLHLLDAPRFSHITNSRAEICIRLPPLVFRNHRCCITHLSPRLFTTRRSHDARSLSYFFHRPQFFPGS